MKTTAHYQRTVPFTSRVALPLLAAGSLFGQAVPPAPPVLPAAYAEIVELSPFTVNATADKGYRAENTLAGSRLNSSLRDTPSSISVFTEKSLEDRGINQIEDFVGYTVGSTLAVQDTNAAPNANAAINGQSLVRGIDIRGIGASQGIDYVKNITPNDVYRIGRYDESRGPNGILFGLSSAGGLINQSSLLAMTHRDSGKVSYEIGHGAAAANRWEFRANKVVVPKKLAVAISAVDQQNAGWRKPDYQDKRRLFGALTFTPNDRVTLRVAAGAATNSARGSHPTRSSTGRSRGSTIATPKESQPSRSCRTMPPPPPPHNSPSVSWAVTLAQNFTRAFPRHAERPAQRFQRLRSARHCSAALLLDARLHHPRRPRDRLQPRRFCRPSLHPPHDDVRLLKFRCFAVSVSKPGDRPAPVSPANLEGHRVRQVGVAAGILACRACRAVRCSEPYRPGGL